MKKRVAVFDDDEDILFIAQHILEQAGWEVKTFTNVDNILEKVAEAQPDVILMDNWIPLNGGISATREIKGSQFSGIPVVYFTANNNVKALSMQAGADFWIAKPFELDELVGVVELARSFSSSWKGTEKATAQFLATTFVLGQVSTSREK